MRIVAYVALGFAGGTTVALALLRGARHTPFHHQLPPPTQSHVRVQSRAYDWQRTDAA